MNKKVYYQGNYIRNNEIYKALEDLGGINYHLLHFIYSSCYYYIGDDNIILETSSKDWLEENGYIEGVLPELEIIEFNGKKYNKFDFMERIKHLETID